MSYHNLIFFVWASSVLATSMARTGNAAAFAPSLPKVHLRAPKVVILPTASGRQRTVMPWFTATASKGGEKQNLVVNYHFLRTCNYACKFCFHTAKTSHIAPLEDAMKALQILVNHGMTRINFSGGEPFLQEHHLGELIKYCKEVLGIKTSIVSNGSLMRENWFYTYGKYLDALAISCDSFDSDTLDAIGRGDGKRNAGGRHLEQLKFIKAWCGEYNVTFKINSVVCRENVEEDMFKEILDLRPERWKVFQCLLIGGENAGADAKHNAGAQVVSDAEFAAFVERHSICDEMLVPESNAAMRNSYLILDEYLRFLDNTSGVKKPSSVNVLEDVRQALSESGFDSVMFKQRGGEWSTKKLEW